MTAADTQILLNKLQSNINQLELTNKGALNALEFRLDAILQANLDTFWLLICAILVFLMQAGFMCLETGLSRNKNSINVALKNVSDFGISVVVFWAFGFALMYGTSVSGLFGTKFFFFTTKVAGYQTYFVFQAMFVATAATIISGAVAERLKFLSYVIITFFASGFFYPIVGHWSWAFNFDDPSEKFGWLGKLGYLDFAGASVVHSVGGVAAFAGAKVLGARIGKFDKDGNPRAMPGHHIPMAMLGTLILLFGWFGFNAASTFAATDVQFATVATNTAIAGAFGAITAMFWITKRSGKPDPGMMANGMLAGLVAVTAPCAFIAPWAAAVIGIIAAVLVIESVFFVERKLKLDDPVGAISVHGVGGLFGTLCVGIFSNGSYGAGWNLSDSDGVKGIIKGDWGQLGAQALGVAVIVVVIGGIAYTFFKLQDTISKKMGKGGIRSSEEDELVGLDIPEMGVYAYPEFVKS